MDVQIRRVNDNYHFEATGISPVSVHIDASPEIGGENKGARPMELLLMGLGSCAAIDVVLILKKQKQIIEDFTIDVKGDRTQLANTSPFNNIHITFTITGDVDKGKAERAVELSVEKYCSVHTMLHQVCQITYSCVVKSA